MLGRRAGRSSPVVVYFFVHCLPVAPQNTLAADSTSSFAPKKTENQGSACDLGHPVSPTMFSRYSCITRWAPSVVISSFPVEFPESFQTLFLFCFSFVRCISQVLAVRSLVRAVINDRLNPTPFFPQALPTIIRRQWSDLDLYNLSASEQAQFCQSREAEYSRRRLRIQAHCGKLLLPREDQNQNIDTLQTMMTLRPYFYQYIPKHNIGYCFVPKVLTTCQISFFLSCC